MAPSTTLSVTPRDWRETQKAARDSLKRHIGSLPISPHWVHLAAVAAFVVWQIRAKRQEINEQRELQVPVEYRAIGRIHQEVREALGGFDDDEDHSALLLKETRLSSAVFEGLSRKQRKAMFDWDRDDTICTTMNKNAVIRQAFFGQVCSSNTNFRISVY